MTRAYVTPAQPISANVVYASRAGVPLNSSLTIGGGTDAAATLNAILATAPARGSLTLIIDGPALVQAAPLKVYSNTTIIFTPAGGIWCGAGLNGPAIRNAHWISSCIGGTLVADGSRTGYTTDFLGANIVDQNISIVAEGGPGQPTIVGNRGNGTSGNCSSGDARFSGTNSGGTPVGMYIAPMMMFGVKGLRIENVTLQDPPSFGFWIANAFGVRCYGLACFDPYTLAGNTPGFTRNTDSFHMNGPIDDLVLRGLSCSANDDSVAFNAADGNLWLAGSGGNGPGIFAGWSTVFGGPITRVTIDDARFTNSLNGVRLLCGAYLIDQVTIRSVKGSLYGGSVVATPFGSIPGGGSIGVIRFEDWQAIQTGLTSGAVTIALGYPCSQWSWQSQSVLPAGRYTPSLTVSSVVGRVEIRNDVIETGATVQAAWLHIASGGAVAIASIAGTRNRSGQAASTTPIVQVDTGTTLNHLLLNGITDINGGGLLANAGTMTSARSVGSDQSGTTATGIANTGTLPTLTGSGNVGVTFTGTIASSSTFVSA